MTTYIIRRLLQSVLIMIGLAVLFFALLRLSPQGPCDGYREAGGLNAQNKINACMLRYGLNDPLPVQFVKWLGNVAHGDLGVTKEGLPVGPAILARIPATVILVGSAYLLQLLIALPLGILGALKRYSFFDQLLTFLSYIFLSTPTFWLGLIGILIFAVFLGVLPAAGIGSIYLPAFGTHGYWVAFTQHPFTVIGDLLYHLILPACILAIVGIGADSRFMRASMLDVINQDYVRTARAKGLPRRVVILKHALRNALLPIVTNVGLFLPTLVSGAVITEGIFGWPGLGQMFIDALGNQSYATLQALLLISAMATLLANLLTDLTYAWVDPRIKFD